MAALKRMMKRIFRILVVTAMIFLPLAGSSQQYMQASLQKDAVPNKLDIVFKANFANTGGEYISEMLFSLAIPATDAIGVTAVAQGINFFSDMGTLSPIPPYTYNGETIFGWIFLTTIPLNHTWPLNLPFPGVQVTFSGGAWAAYVKMVDFTNDGGGPNNYTYFDIVSSDVTHGFFGDITNYSTRFFQMFGFNVLGTYPNNDQYVQTTDLIGLPVSNLQFSGYRAGEKNILNWSSVNEINSRGFDMQRSVDGINYQSIGFVNSKAPGGSSNSRLDYTFTDFSPPGSKQYYRLRQVDLSNRGTLSNIVLIKGAPPIITAIEGLFPNPANNFVNVMLSSPVPAKMNLLVSDMAGRIVMQKNIIVETGSNTVPLDISRFSAGGYMIRLICGNGGCESGAVRFIKQQ